VDARDVDLKKVTKLQNKLAKQMQKANKTREKLERARSGQSTSADGSFGDPSPSR
jgi:hypothetical protein